MATDAKFGPVITLHVYMIFGYRKRKLATSLSCFSFSAVTMEMGKLLRWKFQGKPTSCDGAVLLTLPTTLSAQLPILSALWKILYNNFFHCWSDTRVRFHLFIYFLNEGLFHVNFYPPLFYSTAKFVSGEDKELPHIGIGVSRVVTTSIQIVLSLYFINIEMVLELEIGMCKEIYVADLATLELAVYFLGNTW